MQPFEISQFGNDDYTVPVAVTGLAVSVIVWFAAHLFSRVTRPSIKGALPLQQEMPSVEQGEQRFASLVDACEVCGAEATHLGVVTGRSWFDRMPFLSRLNTLYGMPWRYTVVDDWSKGRRLCAVHHTCAVQRLEQAHAQMRNDHAQFNAQQHQKISMLDQGLIQLVREDQELIKQTIGLRGGVRRSIAPLRVVEHDEDAVVHLPAITTGKGD